MLTQVSESDCSTQRRLQGARGVVSVVRDLVWRDIVLVVHRAPGRSCSRNGHDRGEHCGTNQFTVVDHFCPPARGSPTTANASDSPQMQSDTTTTPVAIGVSPPESIPSDDPSNELSPPPIAPSNNRRQIRLLTSPEHPLRQSIAYASNVTAEALREDWGRDTRVFTNDRRWQ